MIKKYWKNAVSLILVFALLLQIYPLTVQADDSLPDNLECEPQTGLTSLYEYTPFDIWSAGTAYVNTYLGELHLRRSDLTLGGERMPVTIEFYYDPVNDASDNPYGSGWSTSYNQRITYDAANVRYSYKNENGTLIYFVNSGTLTEAGEEIWTEDTEYGVGENGVELHRSAAAAFTDYTAVSIMNGDVAYTFDSTGRLVQMSSGLNQIAITYVDSTTDSIDYITDPVGRKFCFSYSNGVLTYIRARSESDTLITGAVVGYTVTDGKMVNVTYGATNTVTYSYDAAGRMIGASNVDLCGYTFAYTGDSNVVSMVTAKAAMGTEDEATGIITTIERPADNQVVITEESTQQKYTFDGCGRVTNCELLMLTTETAEQSLGSSSFTCVYGYNLSYGFVTQDDGTIINTVTDMQAYDADGIIQDDTGEDTEEDESAEETVPEETIYEDYLTETDDYGNITSQSHVVGELEQSTQYEYSDDHNYISEVVDENGNATAYTYDSLTGLLSSIEDGNGNTTRYTYNALRELTSVQMNVSGLKKIGLDVSKLTNGASQMSVNYTYENGRLKTLTYGSLVYGFTYDIWGNILTVVMNGLTLVTYDYGDNAHLGQVQTLTYGNGKEVFYTYNSLGQVQSVGYTGQLGRFTYSYDSDGALKSVYDSVLNQRTRYSETGYSVASGEYTSPSEFMYEYSSDENGNYSEAVYGTGIDYAIVSEENVTTQTATRSGSAFYSTSTAYDAFSRLERKVVSAGNVNLTQSYSYDTTDGTTGTLVSQYSTSYTGSSASWNLQFSYTYDGNGNITGVTRTDQTSSGSNSYTYTYTYDQAGQLTSATDTETGTYYSYAYDEHGNVMGMGCYQLNADGSKTLIDQKVLSYSGSLLRGYRSPVNGLVTYEFDAMGNPVRISTSAGTSTLTWGEGRMLTSIFQNAGNATTYTYNADGLRAKKVVTEDGVSTTTEYMWGSNGLAGYRTGNTTVIVLYDSEGSPVGFSVDGQAFTYVKNLQGDVIRILDRNGNIMVSYTYDPWGVPTVTGNARLAALNPCSYRGYDYDEETGYYYLQSRYYDPEIGRFINADSPEYLGASGNCLGNNAFLYCENNPISDMDVSGTISFDQLKKAISNLLNSFVKAAIEEITNIFTLENGYLELKNSVLAAAIDGTIMLYCAVGALIAKVAIKTVVRDFLLKRTAESKKFIRFLIDLLLKPGIVGVVVAALGYVFKWSKYKINAYTSGIIQNLLDSRTKLLSKVYTIYSAISSAGSFVAFCFDLFDGNPNGYIRLKFA